MKIKDLPRNTTLMILGSFFAIIILLCSSLAISNINIDEVSFPSHYSFLLVIDFLALGCSKLLLLLKKKNNNLIAKTHYFTLFGLSIVSAVLAALYFLSNYFLMASALLLLLSVVVNRIFLIVRYHEYARTWVLSILITLLAFVLELAIVIEAALTVLMCVIIIGLILMIVAFIDVMSYVFINLQKSIFLEVVRKSHALEILLGLLVLIISFSIILASVEADFNNYGDALWYCFAVVTTIGFGDYSCYTITGRILSVILGAYGLIVVALITSIIVNFYNETSKRTQATVEKIDKNVNKIKDAVTKEENKDKQKD